MEGGGYRYIFMGGGLLLYLLYWCSVPCFTWSGALEIKISGVRLSYTLVSLASHMTNRQCTDIHSLSNIYTYKHIYKLTVLQKLQREANISEEQADPDLERQRYKERLDDKLRAESGSKREKQKEAPIKRPRRDRDISPLTEFTDGGIPHNNGLFHRLKANYLNKIVKGCELMLTLGKDKDINKNNKGIKGLEEYNLTMPFIPAFDLRMCKPGLGTIRAPEEIDDRYVKSNFQLISVDQLQRGPKGGLC